MPEYKMPIREQNSNKGTFGKVLNFSGSNNYIGAAYLSSAAVLKTGAGYVGLATKPNIVRSVSTMLPEAVYLSRKEGLKALNNYSAVLIGCGLGHGFFDKLLFISVLKKLKKNQKPTVIDADGLNILSQLKNIKLSEQTIITPHPLEAARLLGLKLEDILFDLEGSAKKLVEKYDCVVVLKTHRTIIADKNNFYINKHGNSALAKAGSGDVLAGVITGLLAQKTKPFEAAKLGVYIHSRAGEIASNELTEYSVLASELPTFLHKAIKECL